MNSYVAASYNCAKVLETHCALSTRREGSLRCWILGRHPLYIVMDSYNPQINITIGWDGLGDLPDWDFDMDDYDWF